MEGYVARDLFGPLRAYYKITGRKRKGAAPTKKIAFLSSAGIQERDVPLVDVPPLLIMSELAPPGIFFDAPPGPARARYPGQGWIWYSAEYPQYVGRLKKADETKIDIEFRFRVDVFARFLAKVAHGFAIAQFGPNSFEPYLRDVIVGNDPNIGYLVGGDEPPTKPDPPLPEGRHRVTGHQMALGQVAAGSGRLLVCWIRLFPFTGAPSYAVVVGVPGPKIVEELG